MAELVFDSNLWSEIKDNKLSRAGVFEYYGSEIDAPIPDKVYKVFRPPEELNNEETINSFKLAPWVIDHQMLGKKYDAPAEDKGIHGVIGEDVYFDEADGWLKGNIKIFSDTLEEEIEAGKDELSLGYACTYDFSSPGAWNGERYEVVQRNIRGNHLASVDSSRTDVAVMDSTSGVAMDSMIFSIDKKRLRKMSRNRKTPRFKNPPKQADQATAATDDAMDTMHDTMNGMNGMNGSYSMNDDMSGLKEMMSSMMEMMKSMAGNKNGEDGDYEDDGMKGDTFDADKDNDKEKKDKDKDDDKDKDKDKKYEDKGEGKDDKKASTGEASKGKAMDSAIEEAVSKAVKPLLTEIEKLQSSYQAMDGSVAKALNSRDELAEKISREVGTFDHKSMSLKEVARYGVEKIEIPHEKGHEITALNAYFHNRSKTGPKIQLKTGQDSNSHDSDLVESYIMGGE